MNPMKPETRLAESKLDLQKMGMTPKERHAEKMQLCLDWIYRWGCSSVGVLDILLNVQRAGFPAKLVKSGLLSSTTTESGGLARGIPAAYLVLTDAGLSEALRFASELLQYNTNPLWVKQPLLRHNLLVQRITANALVAGSIADYKTEQQSAAKSRSGIKQPDVMWYTAAGTKIGVELELTAKWYRQFDEFILRVVRLLTKENPGADKVVFATDSPAILDRYRSAFTAGNKVPLWREDNNKHWIIAKENKQVKTFSVPNLEGKIQWILIEY